MEPEENLAGDFGGGDFKMVRKTYRRFAVIFLILVILGLGGYYAWSNYLSPRAKERKRMAENVEKFMKANENFEKTMRADTYGGKTPKETLDLLIAALKKDDLDLASKYFELEMDTEDPDYLTRRKWEEALRKTKEEKRILEVVSILERATPAGSAYEGVFGFKVVDEKGEVVYDIDLRLNEYSKVWKLQDL